MIFLLIFAIMAAAAFRGSLTSVQAIGNMQWRSEAIAAANDAIDRLLSTAAFATDAALIDRSRSMPAPFQVDINGDGVNDIATSLPVVTVDGVAKAGPRCLRAEPIPTKDLDPTLAADMGCFGSSSSASSALASRWARRRRHRHAVAVAVFQHRVDDHRARGRCSDQHQRGRRARRRCTGADDRRARYATDTRVASE